MNNVVYVILSHNLFAKVTIKFINIVIILSDIISCCSNFIPYNVVWKVIYFLFKICIFHTHTHTPIIYWKCTKNENFFEDAFKRFIRISSSQSHPVYLRAFTRIVIYSLRLRVFALAFTILRKILVSIYRSAIRTIR